MKKYILLYVVLGLCFFSKGQTDTLSFQDCLDLISMDNPSVQRAMLGEELSEIERRATRMRMLPSLNASITNYNNWGRGIDPTTNDFFNTQFQSFSGGVNANMDLFRGLKQYQQNHKSNLAVDQQRINLQNILAEVTIQLASRFTDIIYLEEQIKANKEVLTDTEKQIELVELKYKEGYVSESEVYKIKAAYANDEYNLALNEQQLALAKLELKQMLNLPFDKKIELRRPEKELAAINLLNIDVKSYVEKAVKANPAFRLSELKTEMLEKDLKIAKGDLYPSLSTSFGLGSIFSTTNQNVSAAEQINTNFAYSLRFRLSIPLFNQMQTSCNIASTQRAIWMAEKDVQNERSRLSAVVFQALNNARGSQKRYTSMQTAMEYSQKSYEVDLLKFELGKIDFTALTLSRAAYLQAQSNLIQAKYDLMFNLALISFYINQEFQL